MSQWILIAGLAAVFAGLAGAVAVATEIGRRRSQVSRSLAAVAAASGPVAPELVEFLEPRFGSRVLVPARAGLADLARKLTPSDWAARTRHRLDLAGNPPAWDRERILAAKAAAALGLGGAVGLLMLLQGRTAFALALGAGAGVLGFFLPELLLKNTAQKRTARMRRELPDAVDLLSISVESGLAFDAALAQVASHAEGPLGAELRRVLQEIQIGKGRSQALRDLASRTEIDEMRTFLGALVQAEALGIPIVDVLRVQAKEMRLKRSQRAEELAMKLPVKIIFPVMLGIMPAILIVILGPAVIRLVQTFT